ncbi:MAG: hypothetical protein MMC33_002952 [Icmadophila ericetorum]|nr:hypothetical protein [Icmadophila ericetorum]
MVSIFDMTRNLSFYTIPAAWVLCLAPHVWATQAYDAASSKKFDLTEPRSFAARVKEDQTITKAQRDMIIRAEGAQQNGFENIGLFAAAVTAANLAGGLDNQTLNLLSGGYLLSRIVYNFVYINNDSLGLANTRTGVFLTGIAIKMAMFAMAGNNLRKAVAVKL